MAKERKLGDIATHLIHENERVRIWNLILEPGESSAFHHHTNDYITISLEGDRMRVEGEKDGPKEIDVELGDWMYRYAHEPHIATNIGKKPFKNILIEFK
ncbi:MAG: cupin domain-containing protein [Chloroflexi bacterium]|nr:cupin domain-containing protein [Chloroflexota bacterium]